MKILEEYYKVVSKVLKEVDVVNRKYSTIRQLVEEHNDPRIYLASCIDSIHTKISYIKSLCKSKEYSDELLKNISETLICIGIQCSYYINTYNKEINDVNVHNMVKQINTLFDPIYLGVDKSIYDRHKLVYDFKSSRETITVSDSFSNVDPYMIFKLFGHLSRINYILFSKISRNKRTKGVYIYCNIYVNKADDLIDLLKTITNYSQKDGEYEFGWEFSHFIQLIQKELYNYKQSRCYQNLELAKYIYNSVKHSSPDPISCWNSTLLKETTEEMKNE